MDTSGIPNQHEEYIQSSINFLIKTIPTYDGLLKYMEENDGWLPLPDHYTDLLSKIPPWSALYEDKDRLNELAEIICFGNQAINMETLNSFFKHSIQPKNQFGIDIKIHQKKIRACEQSDKRHFN